MKRWRLTGTVTMDVSVSVVANTLDEAIEIAEENVSITEFCGGEAGVEYYVSEVDDADFTEGGFGIEWQREFCKLVDEWDEEDEEDDEED